MTAIVYVTKNFGFRRGEIYFADLDPHYGSEQGGKRPVIIIQNDVGNKFAPTVIVAAVTSRISKKPNQPTHVLIDKNPAFSRPSVVLLEQIFTIDKERINNFMGLTSEWEMKQIEEALLKSLGINKFVRYQEGAELYSMGLHTFEELAKEAGAIYKIRRVVLVNLEIFEEYLDTFRM